MYRNSGNFHHQEYFVIYTVYKKLENETFLCAKNENYEHKRSSLPILHIDLENSAFLFGMAILPLTQDSTYLCRYESHEYSFQVRSRPSSRTVIHVSRVENFVF